VDGDEELALNWRRCDGCWGGAKAGWFSELVEFCGRASLLKIRRMARLNGMEDERLDCLESVCFYGIDVSENCSLLMMMPSNNTSLMTP
jgi:hypothetical protein